MGCRNILPAGHCRQNGIVKPPLCESCAELLIPLEPPFCPRCGCSNPAGEVACASCQGRAFYFSGNRAVYAYEDLIRDMIHDMKFRRKRPIAEGMGILLANALAKNISCDLFVPVPMHPHKKRLRGFNQAEILAEALAQKTRIPAANALKRILDTPPQSGLSPRGRMENMADAFISNKKIEIRGKKICLTDDIFTTGATLNACAKTLIENGAAEIVCVTFAIIVKK
jgi:ComF family protein